MKLRYSCFVFLISIFPTLAAAAPVHIVANDKGFDAPAKISAGMRHILFDNHGHDIHEVMFVKLPKGMTAAEHLTQV